MATYCDKTFRSDNYQNSRPTYPDQFFDHLASYIGKRPATIVDVGCGTGQATRSLAKIGDQVYGFDMSPVMIEQAKSSTTASNVKYDVGDDLTFVDKVEPHSVDLVTVAEAAHWLHYPQFFDNVRTVLKPGGVLAFWAYVNFTFIGYPAVGEIIRDCNWNPERYGNLWDEGRRYLDHLYKNIIPPEDSFTDVEYRVNDFDALRSEEPLEIVKLGVPVKAMIQFLRTYSTYHTWKRLNPDKKDMVDQLAEEIFAKTGLNEDSIVDVKWDTVYVFARLK